MDGTTPVMSVSQRKKIENIDTFCRSCGYDISVIAQFITENHNELTDNEVSIIEVLWGSIEGLQSGSAKYSQTEAIKIVGCVLSIPKLVFTMTDVMRKVVVLVIHFLKIIFRITDLKVIFDPKCSEKSINLHELSGLAEKMERIEVCIDAVDVAEDVDEPALHSLVSNVDIHIGVDQIGILKSRIQTMMSEGDMKVCLHLLTLFVRISTVRHSLLFRMITCLKTNNYGKHTSETLQKYIEKERSDGEQFLRFFSGPSLKNVGVLSVFEPAEQTELTAYLEDMHIPLKDLSKVLDGRIFLIQPFTNSSILLGRPFPSISAARAMKSSTDVDNIRIRFQFKAIDGSFNLFHICSPDLYEHLYMQSGLYCIYAKKFQSRTGAQWRIIQVREDSESDYMSSLFVLCTKKRPQQFLYMEKTFFECARGLEENIPPTKECLFKVSYISTLNDFLQFKKKINNVRLLNSLPKLQVLLHFKNTCYQKFTY